MGPYANTPSISCSAMFFFVGKSVPSPLTNFPRTNQTNKYGGLMSNHKFISFWFYPKVTKSEDIQATQQLNFTNELGDKRKAESQPEVFAGKGKRDRKYQMSWERDFPGLVQDGENNTMKCKLCRSFPEIADKSSTLFIGNSAFRCTTIQAHPQSKTYFKCFEANSAQENPGGTTMRTVLRNMNARVWMHKSK